MIDHTQSWGRGQPRLLTECYDDNGILKVPDEYGAIMPTREENYVFLQQFFGEIFNTFPDPYVHMGGDEVSYYCWYVFLSSLMNFKKKQSLSFVHSTK